MTDPNPKTNGPETPPGSGPDRDRLAQATADALRELLEGHATDEGHRCLDFCPICRAADVLRASATPELREQWQVVQREALLTLKTVIDRQVERLEDDTPPPEPRVEDIRID